MVMPLFTQMQTLSLSKTSTNDNCTEPTPLLADIFQAAMSKHDLPNKNIEWEQRFQKIKRSNALSTRFDSAVKNNESLNFLDEEQIDDEFAPVLSMDTFKLAIRKFNSKAIGFYFTYNSGKTDFLAKKIYEIMKATSKGGKTNHEQWTNFVIEIILQNQPALRPNFLHKYVLINKHNKVMHEDGEKNTPEERAFCIFLRGVLWDIAHCFKFDDQSLFKKFHRSTLEWILKSEEQGLTIITLPKEFIKERIEQLARSAVSVEPS